MDDDVAVGELEAMHDRNRGNDDKWGYDPGEHPRSWLDAHRPNEKKISYGHRRKAKVSVKGN